MKIHLSYTWTEFANINGVPFSTGGEIIHFHPEYESAFLGGLPSGTEANETGSSFIYLLGNLVDEMSEDTVSQIHYWRPRLILLTDIEGGEEEIDQRHILTTYIVSGGNFGI